MTGRLHKICLWTLALGALMPLPAFAFDAADVAGFLSGHNSIVVTKIENEAIYARSDRANILVEVSGNHGDVSYLAVLTGISGRDIDRDLLNRFNRRVKFGRAYVLTDGDVAIQMDRNAEGGITERNVRSDIDVFIQLVRQFVRDMRGHAGA